MSSREIFTKMFEENNFMKEKKLYIKSIKVYITCISLENTFIY
jgi:hypothetical protein